MELLLPDHCARPEIEAVEEVLKNYLLWQFEVARCYAGSDFHLAQPLLGQFGSVFVAVFSAGLRFLRFALGNGGGKKDAVASYGSAAALLEQLSAGFLKEWAEAKAGRQSRLPMSSKRRASGKTVSAYLDYT